MIKFLLGAMKKIKTLSVLFDEKYRFKRNVFLCLIIFSTLFHHSKAQQTNSETSTPVVAATSNNLKKDIQTTEGRYRIGPGDVLDIRVLNRPTYSRDAVRVSDKGIITMPFIMQDIQAACLTETELAQEISKLYLKILRNPQVDVFVKEYNSQTVAVIGAVNTPRLFQLQRRVRLLEVLALVGGPSQRAGADLQIIHSNTTFSCEDKSTKASDTTNNETVSTSGIRIDVYKLNEILQGDDRANPYLQPGDIVKVPDAAQAFIVGNIMRPMIIPLGERITVTRAIAMAGGTLPDTKSSEVKIVRESTDGMTTSLIVNLDAIRKQRAQDVVLQPNDIVEVPSKSGFVKSLKGLVNGIVPTLMGLPITVIR
jgi:polysaccharide export outer membrane protein